MYPFSIFGIYGGIICYLTFLNITVMLLCIFISLAHCYTGGGCCDLGGMGASCVK